MLNKQTGNMYPFVTHTWNPIKGVCPHDCVYCYMKKWKLNPLRLVEKELNFDLGDGKYISVGSGTDMWCKEVQDFWIDSVLACSRAYPQNTYLFQSKNPARFKDWLNELPPHSVLATTIETNRTYSEKISDAPCVFDRMRAMSEIEYCRKTVTIEPIINFDVDELIAMVVLVCPEFVSIGADSQRHHLPEPSGDKIRALIAGLEKVTQVIQKDNLKRLLSPP